MWHMSCSFPSSQCLLSLWPNSNTADLIRGFPGVVVFQSPSRVQLFATSWTAAHQASQCFTVSWSLLRFMSIELVMLFSHLILSCPLLLLPSIFPSIRTFSVSRFFASGGQSIRTSASVQFSSVQSLNHVFVTPYTIACQAPLSSTISQSLLRFMFIELVMLSNHLILSCPLLLLPSIFPSIRVFSNE